MKLSDYTAMKRGYQASLAKLLGVSPQAMYQWVRGVRPVPIEHCLTIERATGGLVTRGDLRPHDKHLIWADIANDPEPPPPQSTDASIG